MSPSRPGEEWIVGRDRELALLADLVNEVTAESADLPGALPGVLVVTGGPGAGKSVLLDAVGRTALRAGLRVLRCRGCEGESGLPFAGLHQLLRPVLDLAGGLPVRQRAALLGVFGLDPEQAQDTVPDPLLTSLGALTLLSDAASRGPLLLVIDDAHWLDVGTLDVLAFVARRLEGEPVAMVLAARDNAVPPQFARERRQLTIEPLATAAAGRLLDLQPEPPVGRARSRILDQAAGVPLALVELARAVSRDPAAGQDGATDTLPLTDRLEAIFAADLPELPAPTRRLLLLAAAAETAELPVILSAAGDTAAPADWRPAEIAGLVRIDDGRLHFRHPLIRSAVYQSASYAERHAAHTALADILAGDPDRRAWHRAAAVSGVDEKAAQGLEDSADRAQRRGGYAGAAAALERAARLSPDPDVRAKRLVRAATMAMYSGHPRWVGELATHALTLTDDPAVLAEASLRAGWALAVTSRFEDSLGFLLPVAEAAVDTDPALALDALSTATTASYHFGDPSLREKIQRVTDRVPPQGDEASRLWVLAGCDPVRHREQALALLRGTEWTENPPGTPFGAARDRRLSRLVVVGAAAWVLDETAEAVRLLGAALDHLRRSPTAGVNATVAWVLATTLYESGSWTQARSIGDEAYRTAAEAGLEVVAVGAPVLGATILALRGDTEAARAAVQRAVHGIDLPGSRSLRVRTHYALGAAALAEGDHATAYARFRAVYTQDAEPEPVHFQASDYFLADLAAAAVRTGRADEARRIVGATRRRLAAGGVSARLDAVLHRADALLSEGAEAEEHFTAALAGPDGEQWLFERALVRLDYAEWLRRRRRSVEARPQLTAALDTFERVGARPWTERARAELRATGVTPTSTAPRDALAELTPQQLQIARLAAAGLTNREIGERIFLSPRTVGFHLYRVFPKLGITGRAQLRDALPESSGSLDGTPAP
ncbi:helix-turn-helix transcriptional regulator [Streptomyces sp. NBC_00576]|uniref:helix-turn-helix transcriptional regulator n=1 Tax=Streptomyces sp. NBC_00576 TaxID=2903665 RepID=UPI002E81CEDD|nr:LuxR family transcriptional regulator [Streptomyces sp. NBC_00576]WUB69250.1 LuxR family transcriptional regulator [Streptomyces sp. NBC_00576]